MAQLYHQVIVYLENRVNYTMMDMLLRRQMDAGINAVVVAGTTGEAPTLSDDEKRELIQRAKDFAGDGCAIIAGTGSNDTAYSIYKDVDFFATGLSCLCKKSLYFAISHNHSPLTFLTDLHLIEILTL